MFVAAVFVLAGLTKGVIGLGLPTVSMGLLALVMSPPEAAALLVLPSFLTNLWQMLAGPSLRAVMRAAVADDAGRVPRHMGRRRPDDRAAGHVRQRAARAGAGGLRADRTGCDGTAADQPGGRSDGWGRR